MPDDWFEQNKPKRVTATPPAPSEDDWFVRNKPVKRDSGPPVKMDMPGPSNKDLANIGKYLPGALATTAAILQPELIPVAGGFLAETGAGTAAALGGAAVGSAVNQGIQKATGDEDRPKGFKEFVKQIGKDSAEQGAYELGGRIIAKPFSFLASKFKPEGLYQSALKPSIAMSVPERDKIIKTGLREGIPASRAGYDKLIASITDLTGQINKKIADKSTDIGAVISPKVVTQRLDALLDHYATQAAPGADINAIKDVRDQFLKRHSYEAPYSEVRVGTDDAAGQIIPTGKKGSTTVLKDMTLAEAQAEKRGTQRFSNYDETKAARNAAEKTIASSLREQISAIFPEVQALNKRDSDMLALEEELRKFVGREGNKNKVGLVTAVIGAGAGAFGAASGDHREEIGGGTMLALSLLALDNPEIKTKLAISLAKAAKLRGAKPVGKLATRLGKEVPPGILRAARPLSSLTSTPPDAPTSIPPQ